MSCLFNRDIPSCLFNRDIPMIKNLVVAAALSIGLAGYAFAQDTTTGAPAGTTPVTPAPGTPLPIPGVTPAPTGSHSSQLAEIQLVGSSAPGL